jgi:hypothetical protein
MKSRFSFSLVLIILVAIQTIHAQGFSGPYAPPFWQFNQASPMDQIISWDQDTLKLNVNASPGIVAQPTFQSSCHVNVSFTWSLDSTNYMDFGYMVFIGPNAYNQTDFPPGQFGPAPVAFGSPIVIIFTKFNPSAPDGHVSIYNFTVASTDTVAPVSFLPSNIILSADSGECCKKASYLTGPSIIFYDHPYTPGSNLSYNTNDGTSSASETEYIMNANVVFTGVSVVEKVCSPLPSSVDLYVYKDGPSPLLYSANIDSANYEVAFVDTNMTGDSLYRFTIMFPDILFEASGSGDALRIGIQGNNAGCFEWVMDDIPGNDLNAWVTNGSLDTTDWTNVLPIFGEPIMTLFYKPITNLFADSVCGLASVVQTAGLPSGACFPGGTTTNTFEATDNAGNITTASFTVHVTGSLPPVPVETTLQTLVGLCGIAVTSPPKAINPCTGDTILGTTTDLIAFYDPGIYTVNWLYNDGEGHTSAQEQTVLVVQSDCIGIEEENTADALKIYPNPSNGIFTVSTSLVISTDTQIELINTMGQTLLTNSLQNQHQVFDLSHLPAAVYYILIKDEQGFRQKGTIIKN